jgi:type VI secretion system secreted protein Hcp
MATDMYLKIDGIEGETKDDVHKGSIQLLSFSWGESSPGTFDSALGGMSAGKVSLMEAQFAAVDNKAFPKLALSCAQGSHIKEAKVTIRRAGETPQDYHTFTFTDVLVTGLQISAGGDLPMLNFSLGYGKFETEYKPQKADGTLDAAIKAGYDQKINKKA